MHDTIRPTLKHPAWWLLAVPMAVPALLVVAALAVMLFYSFTDFDVLTPAVFVGLQNYARLFSEPLYWRAVGNTLLYLLVAGGVSVALGWLCGGAARLPLPLRLILLVLFGIGTMLSFCQYSWFNLIFSGDSYGLLNAFLLQPSTPVGDASAASGLITEPVQWAAMYPTAIRLLQLILIGVGPAFFIFYVGGRTGRSRAAWHIAVAALPVWFILYWVITITATGTPTMGYAGLWLPEYLYDYFYTRFDIGYSAVILMNLILLVAVLVGVAQTIVWLCTRHGRPAALPSRPGARHWCGGAVGMTIGVFVLLLVVLLFSYALKPASESFLFPPKFSVQQSPTWNNFRLLESFPGGFLHLLPMYVIVSVVYFLTAILPPAVFFAFSGARLRRPLLIVWMSIFALTPFAFTSVLWWRISIVDALGPVLRLCCHFSPLYPTCLLLTVLLLRRTAAGCHRFSDFFCSARRVLCTVAGVVGCGLLFPLSLLFTLNGTHLVYSSNYYFPLQQVGLHSGMTSFGVGSAGTLVLLFVGLVLLLVGLIGMTVAAHVAVKRQRVGKD